ncbi:MAG: MFS transporter [Candidatus Wallbacteria bacterium]|nr:MFS transporter [Candidatus Wallbacteria bacterium]
MPTPPRPPETPPQPALALPDGTSEPAGPGLQASIRDGMWWAVMVGAGESYLSAFGVFLQATTLQIGVLATLPPLIGALSQGPGVWLMERIRSRRTLVAAGAAAQAIVWVPLALLPFLGVPGPRLVGLLIALAIVYHVMGNHVAPAWNSLIGDMVPARARGRFFGGRNYAIGFCNFAAVLAAGGLLDLAASFGALRAGYLAIFAIAFLARCFSVHWLQQYDDPPYECAPKERLGFLEFLRSGPHANFARFVFFAAALNFGVSLLGPYLTPYMLRDLKLSYLEYTVINAAMTLSQFLTMRYWGGFADRFGFRNIMRLCGWGICLIPLLWLFSPNWVVLALVQTWAGFCWAGFNLACASFVFDAVPGPLRGRCAAWQAIFNAASVFAGSLAGGLLIDRVPSVLTLGPWSWDFRTSLVLLFFASAAMRVVAMTVFLPLFKEVRAVEPIPHQGLIFRIARIRPLTGAAFSVYSDPPERSRPGE